MKIHKDLSISQRAILITSIVIGGLSCSQRLIAPGGPHYIGDTEFQPSSQNPAFKNKHAKLCFDMGHSNLAVTKDFYKPVLYLLNSDGLEIIKLTENFNSKNLKKCNLLYISAALGHSDIAEKKLAARSAFSLNEIHAIKSWVKKGGGLFMSPDHRPMADAMEPLLEAFGIFGSLTNIENSKKNIAPFEDPGIFEISNEQLNAANPIVMGRNSSEQIKRVFFFYGEGFKAPVYADVFMSGGTDSKLHEESDDKKSADYTALGLALKFEKGRVVIHGDGTIFTSKLDLTNNEKTGINRPGSDNIQLALNVFRWVAGLY